MHKHPIRQGWIRSGRDIASYNNLEAYNQCLFRSIAHSHHKSRRGLLIYADSVEEFIRRTRIQPQKWLEQDVLVAFNLRDYVKGSFDSTIESLLESQTQQSKITD